LLSTHLHGQQYYRMKADFSIKQILPDGKQSLSMGKVYYDRTFKKVVYDLKFPEKEVWVIGDSQLVKIANGKVVVKEKVPFLVTSTIFEFALQNNLGNYGLEKSVYKVGEVKKDKDQVITTWVPNEKINKLFGNVVVSRKNNQLFGMAIYNNKNELIQKQLFDGFIKALGVKFPSTITEITYYKNANGTTSKGTKITTYKKLVVNEPNENNIYNYPIPVGVPKK